MDSLGAEFELQRRHTRRAAYTAACGLVRTRDAHIALGAVTRARPKAGRSVCVQVPDAPAWKGEIVRPSVGPTWLRCNLHRVWRC